MSNFSPYDPGFYLQSAGGGFSGDPGFYVQGPVFSGDPGFNLLPMPATPAIQMGAVGSTGGPYPTIGVPISAYRAGQPVPLATTALELGSPIRALPPPSAAAYPVPSMTIPMGPGTGAAASGGRTFVMGPAAAAEGAGGGGFTLPPTAASSVPGAVGAAEAAGTAATAGAAASGWGRLGAMFARGRESMAGRGGMFRAGVAILPGIAAGFIPESGGPWDNMAREALTFGGVGGSIAGVPGAVVGGALGAGLGLVEHFFLSEDDSSGDVQKKINERYERVLDEYGATPEFIRQAQNQFRLAWEVQGGDEGLPPDTVEQLANEVLNGMIQHLQTQQQPQYDPWGMARDQAAEARQYDLAQIAATQAWMQPMMEQIIGQQQQYADAYRDAGLGLAGHVSDPAVAAALEQLAQGYSNQQSVASAVMLQQMAYNPQAMQQQLDAQYQDILNDIALQEAQYNQQILQAGGTLPGQNPIIGGIPLAAAPPAPQYTSINGVPVPSDHNVIDLTNPQTRDLWDQAHPMNVPTSPMPAAAAPVYGTTTTTSTIPPTMPPPPPPPSTAAGGVYGPPAPGVTYSPGGTPTPTAPAPTGPPTGTTIPAGSYAPILAMLPPNATPTQVIQALMNAGVPGPEAERVAQQVTGVEISGFRR